MRLLGRNSIAPEKTFDSSKIRMLGFSPPQTLEVSLREFSVWKKDNLKKNA
jgi:hypothetical protein